MNKPKYKGQRLVNFDLLALAMSVPIGSSGLDHGGRTVLLEICAQQNFSENGKTQWRIFQADLQQRTGLSRRTVQRSLKNLTDNGFVTAHNGDNPYDPHYFLVNVEKLQVLAVAAEQESQRQRAEGSANSQRAKEGRQDGTPMASGWHPTRAKMAPQGRQDDALPKGFLKGQLEGDLKGIEDPDQLDQVAGSNYANRKQALRRDDQVDKTPSKLGTVLSPDALFDRLTKAS